VKNSLENAELELQQKPLNGRTLYAWSFSCKIVQVFRC